MGGRRCLEHEGRMPVRQPYPAVAPIDRLAAIWRLDMPPARSLSTSRSLRMGNLCPGMLRSLVEAMPIRRSPNRADDTHPQPGRDRPEWVVAINRNAWAQSIGIRGRNQPVRAACRRSAEPSRHRPGWYIVAVERLASPCLTARAQPQHHPTSQRSIPCRRRPRAGRDCSWWSCPTTSGRHRT